MKQDTASASSWTMPHCHVCETFHCICNYSWEKRCVIYTNIAIDEIYFLNFPLYFYLELSPIHLIICTTIGTKQLLIYLSLFLAVCSFFLQLMIWGWTPVFFSGPIRSWLSLITARLVWPPWETRLRTISKIGKRINTFQTLGLTQSATSNHNWIDVTSMYGRNC